MQTRNYSLVLAYVGTCCWLTKTCPIDARKLCLTKSIEYVSENQSFEDTMDRLRDFVEGIRSLTALFLDVPRGFFDFGNRLTTKQQENVCKFSVFL